jgi:hypothetical protein
MDDLDEEDHSEHGQSGHELCGDDDFHDGFVRGFLSKSPMLYIRE